MRRTCVGLFVFLFSALIIQNQNAMAEGFEGQIIKVKQEIGNLEDKTREIEEKIEMKVQAQAPAIEIKELEQESLLLRKHIDALRKELVGLGKWQAAADETRLKEEMYHKMDLEAHEINLKLGGLKREFLELDNVYSQEIARGVPEGDLEDIQIRMNQLQEEIKFLEKELKETDKIAE